MLENGYDSIVTTGGIQSNHCRAMALMCAEEGWKCHIVFHGSKERFVNENGNNRITQLAGASCQFVDVHEIADAMDAAISKYRELGMNPLYITGGGHDLPGGLAYVDAVSDLKEYMSSTDLTADYIFLASGTGSTQAGIIVGLEKNNLKVTTVGISVARKSSMAIKIVSSFCQNLRKHLDTNNQSEIHVLDDYLCGGYEFSSIQLDDSIQEIIRRTGIIFDSTYSGKAFYGMILEIGKKKISGNVIFWHTGGLFNFLK